MKAGGSGTHLHSLIDLVTPFLFVTADGPAMAMVSGMVGHTEGLLLLVCGLLVGVEIEMDTIPAMLNPRLQCYRARS